MCFLSLLKLTTYVSEYQNLLFVVRYHSLNVCAGLSGANYSSYSCTHTETGIYLEFTVYSDKEPAHSHLSQVLPHLHNTKSYRVFRMIKCTVHTAATTFLYNQISTAYDCIAHICLSRSFLFI